MGFHICGAPMASNYYAVLECSRRQNERRVRDYSQKVKLWEDGIIKAAQFDICKALKRIFKKDKLISDDELTSFEKYLEEYDWKIGARRFWWLIKRLSNTNTSLRNEMITQCILDFPHMYHEVTPQDVDIYPLLFDKIKKEYALAVLHV